jgi:hypothetical protein
MKDIYGIEEPINPITGRPYNRYRRYERGRDLELLNHVENIIINNLHIHSAANPGHGEEDFDYVNYESVMKDLEDLKQNILDYQYHGGMATSEVIEDIKETI